MNTPESPSPTPQQRALLKLADQCVMCGMCLPHCPTYVKTSNEGESPRGRISLTQALLRNKLPLEPHFKQHLDSCLTCRACEPVCPSGVAYGQIIDGVRAQIRQQSPKRDWRKEKLLETTASPQKLHLSGKMLQLAQRTGTLGLLKKGVEKLVMGDGDWQQLLPQPLPDYHPWKPHYPATGVRKGQVALFTGCIADIADQQTLRDAVTLLTHAGYDVAVPKQQHCCGALHYHEGDQKRAGQLRQKNLEAFELEELDAIIYCATGCGAQLREYGQQQPNQQAAAFSAKCLEIGEFLLQQAELPLQFRPLAQRVAVHTPCTQRYALKQADLPFKLLKLTPEIELIELPGNHQCCGSAGSYMLEQPEMAQQLLNDKLAAIAATAPQIVASSNIGCALHLAAGLRQRGQPLEILHPISLLTRQLVP